MGIENTEIDQRQDYEHNLKVVANFIEVGIASLTPLIGGQITGEYKGENLNDDTLASILASKLNTKLHGRGVIK